MATTHSFGKRHLRSEDGTATIGDVPLLVSKLQSYVAVNSTNALDANGKTGAKQIQIIGLDRDFNRISETLFLKGTENVLSQKQYITLQAVEVIQVGELRANQGIIRLSNEEGLLGKVEPGNNRMLTTSIVIPKGTAGEILSWRGSIDCKHGGSRVTYKLCQLTLTNKVSRVLDEMVLNYALETSNEQSFSAPINKTSILYISAHTDSEGVEVAGGIKVLLESI